MNNMTVQLNPGTRIPLPDGTYSDYGAIVVVDESAGKALTTGPSPSGTEIKDAPPSGKSKK